MAFRDGPFENLKVPLAWTAAVLVVVAIIGAALLLIIDRQPADAQTPLSSARGGVATVVGPVGGVLSAPVRWVGSVGDAIGGYFFAVSENRRLKAQIAELEGWKTDAIAMKNVNARYEALLGLRVEPAVPTVAAHAISEARGPFKNAKLIDVGSAKGVRIGNPVMDKHGLVGRVTDVSGGVSRMVLLTDVASRTPVLIDRTNARAILTGDGSNNPRLEFVRGTGALQVGDRILTSGDGGGLPRGIPVGVAAKGMDGSWRVKLFSDRGAIDYVSVLLFQDFSQLVNPGALATPPLAGLTTAPEPSAAQVAAIGDAAARRQAQAQALAERARAANAASAAAAAPTPVSPPTYTPTTPAATTPARPQAARPAPVRASPAANPASPAPSPTPPATTPPAPEGER